MGLRGFYPWLKKKGCNPTTRNPRYHHLPAGAVIRVDVLTFFHKIRTIFTKYSDDKTRACAILFEYLKKFGDPSRMVLYVDGEAALEKVATHQERERKRNSQLIAANEAIQLFEERVMEGRPPTSQMLKNVEKSLQGGFKWSIRDREDFIEFLQGQQLDARICRTEADIAIAADCQPHDIVLSQDSDFFAYDSIKTIWRPVGKWDKVRVLEYCRTDIIIKAGLSSTKLTALACVSANDYNKNIPSLGIATNYSIIKDLPDSGKNICFTSRLMLPLL